MPGIIGSSIKRREDPALITGRGKYTDDLKIPGMLHAAIVRSPHAHARIRSIDTKAALARRRRGRGLHRGRRGEGRPPRDDPGGLAAAEHEDPGAPDAGERHRPLRRRRRGGGGRRATATPRATPPIWSRSTTSRCRAVIDAARAVEAGAAQIHAEAPRTSRSTGRSATGSAPTTRSPKPPTRPRSSCATSGSSRMPSSRARRSPTTTRRPASSSST